jgi:hypothetical protein
VVGQHWTCPTHDILAPLSAECTALTQILESNRGGEVVGLNPKIRIYRYTKGQFFDQHCISPFPNLLKQCTDNAD